MTFDGFDLLQSLRIKIMSKDIRRVSNDLPPGIYDPDIFA
jgi:hypothetical protein